MIGHNSKPGVLVFTDLDATLLDHETYQFDLALPAIRFLQSQDIPIVPTTSKTVDELIIINQALNNHQPFIAEDGSVIGIPIGYFNKLEAFQEYRSYHLLKLAPDYADVLGVLEAARNTAGFSFLGFNDMTAKMIAEETGLTIEQANNAKHRMCSEPIKWLSDEQELLKFKSLLSEAGLSLVRGGRFWQVLGKTNNKVIAMRKLISLYQSNGLDNIVTIALGDSPNDIEMLKEANTAIIIKRKDGVKLDLERNPTSSKNVIYSTQPGPAGWNDSIFKVFQDSQPTDK